jgi:hypothetical protein
MKINVTVDATAQEMREFLGLPNVQPLQDELLEMIRDNIKKGISGFDALNLMKPLLPPQFQSMELFQKALWDAFTRKGSASQEAVVAAEEKSESRKTD